MKKFKNLVNTILLGVSAISILLSMAIMVWVNAFPKDPEMEVKIPIIQENAAKRAEAIKQLQQEAMCEDERFVHTSSE